MEIVYQDFEEKHSSQIIKLFYDFQDHLTCLDPYQRLRTMPGVGEHALSKALKDVVKNEGLFYLAVDGEKVAGFVVVIVKRLTESDLLGMVPSDPARVTELYIDSPYRGKGIGSELMKKAEEYAKNKGCAVIKVEAFAPNDLARDFYKKLGYEPRDIDHMKQL